MAFLGVYRAIYDYAPQGEGELEVAEGDLLFVLEKSTEDDWWKAKKKAQSDDEDEPEGLVPRTYIEEAQPVYHAKALYDYTKQTDEEISFGDEAMLEVFDTSDPDWTLVGLNGEYGFAPAIYIEKASAGSSSAPAAPPMPVRPQAQQPTPDPEDEFDDDPLESPVQNPARALAGIIAQKTGERQASSGTREFAAPPPSSRPQYTPEESDEELPPPKPVRPQSVAEPDYSSRSAQSAGALPSPSYNRAVSDQYDDDRGLASPRGFHMYNVSEMVSHMGKNKKMPTTLGINAARGIITLSPEKSRDGPTQEWTAEKLSHYSIEGKHVFIELVRPSKSLDLHAGAKDTAKEIVAALGEIAGASRAEGLREVIAAGTGTGAKNGTMLYEFMAQGDDEVTVAAGDEVIVLDDTKSEEWWMIRRLKNGKEGVVPSSYVEVTGISSVPSVSSYAGLNAGKSVVEQNRLEEERMTREAADRDTRRRREESSRSQDVQPPARGSSRKDGSDSKSSKPKPNMGRVRTWTDRSGSFKVEAEFIGLKDNKIHLHKLNGVKIAVPVNKMAVEDLEYVEAQTGVSLDEDKPLSDIKRRSTLKAKDHEPAPTSSRAGASVQQEPEYDWFDFFLQCGCNPQICERYARAFSNDQMGEEVLPQVTPSLLRNLGIKEGDILRIMKNLDTRYNRTRAIGADGQLSNEAAPAADGDGGLFSGPGGALRNNTRKGRPAPAVQTNDVIDPDAFKQEDRTASQATSAPARQASGFDDDAWDLKPSKTDSDIGPPPPPKPASPAVHANAVAPAPAPVQRPAPTGGMAELSLLSPPLQPTPAPAPVVQSQPTAPARPAADPAFFDQLGAPAPVQSLQTGRQRPLAPQTTGGASTIAPPPARAASTPGFSQNQQSQFGTPAPLAPQYTGYMQPMKTGFQAPPGQSLQDMQRQQQMQQMQPQMTGYPQQQFTNGMPMQMTGYNPQFGQQGYQQQLQVGQMTGSPFADPPRAPFQPQPTGMQQSFIQPQQTGLPPPLTPMRTGGFPQQNGFQQPQATGFGQAPQQFPQQTGFPQQNGFQQQQLQPQQTGFAPMQQPMQTGYSNISSIQPQATGFQPQSQFGQSQYGIPQQQQQMQAPAPLVPQKTGPAPPVRFGVQPTARLTPQATGRRANLANASAANPFGF